MMASHARVSQDYNYCMCALCMAIVLEEEFFARQYNFIAYIITDNDKTSTFVSKIFIETSNVVDKPSKIKSLLIMI